MSINIGCMRILTSNNAAAEVIISAFQSGLGPGDVFAGLFQRISKSVFMCLGLL